MKHEPFPPLSSRRLSVFVAAFVPVRLWIARSLGRSDRFV
jgi:hypothetical protein